MDEDLKNLLNHLISHEQLIVQFQPIASLDKQVIYGYEGLIRGPDHSPLREPSVLFEAAAAHERLRDMDFLCRKLIIRQFAELELPGRLFININPITLFTSSFSHDHTLTYLKRYAIDPERVVIEVTETHPIGDRMILQHALRHYHAMGFQVALDDLGSGFSGLKLWSEINPDFVKMDRHFTRGVDEDQTKRQFVMSILEIAKSLNCQVIAEGIEHKREYAVLRRLGITLARGYYFAPPEALPETTLNPLLFSERPRDSTLPHKLTAATLLKPTPIVPPHMPMQAVGELFCSQEGLRSIAVVNHEEPLGLILRSDILNLLAGRYGRDLYGRRPIENFLHKPMLKFELETPLEEISRGLINAADHYIEEFIITAGGRYIGKGMLLDLLRNITELKVNRARYASPLTLLPGNVLVQQMLDEFLQNGEGFHIAYFDLDHFKPYNDVYGYVWGDELIQLTGRLLIEFTHPEPDFVGHIGGDDFIVFFRSADWRERCHKLLRTFEAVIPEYYTAEHRRNGGIDAADRYGQQRHFPFVTLSIGVVPIAPGCCDLSRDVIAEWASSAKAKAKQRIGNVLHVEEMKDGYRPERPKL